MGCRSCELVGRRDAGEAPVWDSILRTEHWDLAHVYSTSIEGWLVIVARRHMAAVAEMTEEEAAALGLLVRRASRALATVTGCVKTYVVQFAEHPQHPHVHFHVIPRMAEQPETHRSTRVFDHLGVPADEAVSEERMNEIGMQVWEALQTI